MEIKNQIALMYNFVSVYRDVCRPICTDIGVPHMAFCILMLLAYYPECQTAKDICNFCSFKPNIVSFNVDKLVRKGYIERQTIPQNRRSIKLVCTEKSRPVIERGTQVLEGFLSSITVGMNESDLATLERYLDLINGNIMELKNSMKQDKSQTEF